MVVIQKRDSNKSSGLSYINEFDGKEEDYASLYQATVKETKGRLDECLKNKLTTLDLSEAGISSEFPENFREVSFIHTLIMSNNIIEEMPSFFYEDFTRLTELNLASNCLKALPKEISKLTNLRVLNLSSNLFETFPMEILGLSSLRDLDLSFCFLEDIPNEIVTLQQLERVSFSNNSLTKLPSFMEQLPSLKVLSLHGNDWTDYDGYILLSQRYTPKVRKGAVLKRKSVAEIAMEERNKLIKEMKETEKKFYGYVKILAEKYVLPLINGKVQWQEKKLIDGSKAKTLFPGNLVNVVNFSEEFLGAMESSFDLSLELGEIFMRNEKKFRNYIYYAVDFEDTHKILMNYLKEKKEMDDYLRATSKVVGQTIHSLLVMPVQRIPRYRLLLESIISLTEESHRDYGHLTKALTIVKETAEKLNKRILESQSQRRMEELVKYLQYPELQSKVDRVFLMEAEVVLYQQSDSLQEAFLFNDLLVISEVSETTLFSSLSKKKHLTLPLSSYKLSEDKELSIVLKDSMSSDEVEITFVGTDFVNDKRRFVNELSKSSKTK